MLIIREKLAELYESEQQWSKAAQMLSGIDLDSGMRSDSKILICFIYLFDYSHEIIQCFISFYVNANIDNLYFPCDASTGGLTIRSG